MVGPLLEAPALAGVHHKAYGTAGGVGAVTAPRALALAALLLLAAAPAASALDVATRSVRARPSGGEPSAWGLGYYGCDVTVAVFDEGIDDSHPYLDGKVVAGYDTTLTGSMWTLANGGNPQPLRGVHGTPVAGIVGSHAGQMFTKAEDAPQWADGDLVGAAPCAWLVDVMFYDLEGATDSDFVAAFDWAIQHKDDTWGDADPSNDGIEVITMSWSPYDNTEGDDPVSKAANKAVAAGIVVLGSVGNTGGRDIGAPSGADGAIGVANLWNDRSKERSDDEIEESSTWGPRNDDGDGDPYDEMKPDVAAPGSGVWTTGPALGDGTEYQAVCVGGTAVLGYGCEVSFGGTSAATPMVAGIVALMLDANPDLEPRDVKEILHRTAEVKAGVAPSQPDRNAKWHEQYGYGMVDAHAAVVMAKSWPGFEAGRDRDSDGVPDVDDMAPEDPKDARVRSPPKATTTTSGPLPAKAPSSPPPEAPSAETPTEVPPGPAEETADEVPVEAKQDSARSTPGTALPLIAAAVGLALLVRRRLW
jgi:subtilisin family serine protease